MSFHSQVSLGARHAIHNWEYANAAARDADTGLLAQDIGKISRTSDDGALWQLIDLTPTWQSLAPTGPAGPAGPASAPKTMNFSWKRIKTKNLVYTASGRIIFPGTTSAGVPSAITVAGAVIDATSPGDVLVYDVTNAAVIATKIGIVSTVPILIPMGALTNLPAGQALWEIQLRVVPATIADDIEIYAMEIAF